MLVWYNPCTWLDACLEACVGSIPSCTTLCAGRAATPYTCLCLPAILLTNSVTTYLLPCAGVYLDRCGHSVGCLLCRMCGCYTYHDNRFFGPSAIGEFKENGRVMEAPADHWIRAEEITRKVKGEPTNEGRMLLFEGSIDPGDVVQGQVGNCWLMAGMACLAEYPGAIQKAFVTREHNARGKYRIRLYDAKAGKFTIVTVDDRIPCKPGTTKPAFTQPNGNELWAMMLEKAFAKFVGSYAALESGQVAWAWEAITGDPAHMLLKFPAGGTTWLREEMVYPDKQSHKRQVTWKTGKEKHQSDQVFKLLKGYKKRCAVISASFFLEGKPQEFRDETGLVSGHAYSVLQVKRAGSYEFVQLRNPWGQDGEWEGPWSDSSRLWDVNPDVKQTLGFTSPTTASSGWSSKTSSSTSRVSPCWTVPTTRICSWTSRRAMAA